MEALYVIGVVIGLVMIWIISQEFASIAAASVLAKTYRDEYMRKLAQEYPQYGWEKNMGYPTPAHVQAIIDHGYTPHHRKSFHLKQLEPTLF